MKVKVKQSFYSVYLERVAAVDEVEEFETEIAKDLINAGYAEEVVEEQPKKNRKKAGDE